MVVRTWRTSALVLVPLLGLCASGRAQETAERRVRSHAVVNQTVRLSGRVNVRGACTVVIPTSIAVLTPPRHGTLAVRDEEVTSKTPELGRRRCLGTTGQGEVVYYSRATPGQDQFDYRSSSENGIVHVTATVD